MGSREKRAGLLMRFQIGNVAPAYSQEREPEQGTRVAAGDSREHSRPQPSLAEIWAKRTQQANPVRYALGKEIPER